MSRLIAAQTQTAWRPVLIILQVNQLSTKKNFQTQNTQLCSPSVLPALASLCPVSLDNQVAHFHRKVVSPSKSFVVSWRSIVSKSKFQDRWDYRESVVASKIQAHRTFFLFCLHFDSYQRELPSRFKKDIMAAAAPRKQPVVMDGLQRVLMNIGAENRLSQSDMEIIFEELGNGRGEIPAMRMIQIL